MTDKEYYNVLAFFCLGVSILLGLLIWWNKSEIRRYKRRQEAEKEKDRFKSALDFMSDEDEKIAELKRQKEESYKNAQEAIEKEADKLRKRYPDAKVEVIFNEWINETTAQFSIAFTQDDNEINDSELLELSEVKIGNVTRYVGVSEECYKIELLGGITKNGRRLKLGEEQADRFIDLLLKEYKNRGKVYDIVIKKKSVLNLGESEDLDGWEWWIGVDLQEEERRSRHIPQSVKDAVWNRDKGRCVECGSQENLEFDHIIPHSKNGANTYRNVQLLCQDCNRSKSNKIG